VQPPGRKIGEISRLQAGCTHVGLTCATRPKWTDVIAKYVYRALAAPAMSQGSVTPSMHASIHGLVVKIVRVANLSRTTCARIGYMYGSA